MSISIRQRASSLICLILHWFARACSVGGSSLWLLQAIIRILLGIKQMFPALLGHRPGRVFGGAIKLHFGVIFGAPVPESKPHQRLDILEHFMKGSLPCLGLFLGYSFGSAAPN